MKPEYVNWINDWLKQNNPYGCCNSATKAMVEAFPELRRAAGYYYCVVWGTSNTLVVHNGD